MIPVDTKHTLVDEKKGGSQYFQILPLKCNIFVKINLLNRNNFTEDTFM